MITYIKNSKDEFVAEISEMFDREIEELGYDLRDRVLVEEAKKQNYEYKVLDDKTMFDLFGTVENFNEAVAEAYQQEKNKLIAKIDFAICMMAAVSRINREIKIYPGYNPDDTTSIAIELVN
jgi:hypothetical protein